MAGYRQIHTKIWKDEWFGDLEPEEKMLFIYLFSNELASIAGIYKIPLKIMVFETGLDKGFILETLAKFEQANKVYYEDGIVWVANMSRYHANASETTRKKVMKDLEMIEDCPIKQKYMKVVWGIDTTINIKTGYQYQSLKDKDKDKDKDKAKEKADESGDDDFDKVLTLVQTLTGTLQTQLDYPAIKEMVELGVIESDIRGAVAYLTAKGYKIRGARSLINAVKVEREKRIQKSTASQFQDDEVVDMKGYTDATIYK